MDGQPVWLASGSLRDRHGEPLPSDAWIDTSERKRVETALMRALAGVGDKSRQRLFRMPVTLCLHRALTDDEVAQLPPGDLVAQHLAGGGVEILWETVPGALSTRPCENPARLPMRPWRPEIYTIVECEECPPCRARLDAAGVLCDGG